MYHYHYSRGTCCRWIAVRSDTLSGIFSGLVGAYLVYGGGSGGAFAAGDVGFALNQILAFSETLLQLVRSVYIAPLPSVNFHVSSRLLQGYIINLKSKLIGGSKSDICGVLLS